MGAVGAVLLAAGASTRMGSVKQLLPWKDSTLLEHAIKQISGVGVDSLVVVLGAHREQIHEQIDFTGIDVTVNSNWEKGMATSIAAGLEYLLKKTPDLQTVLIALSDQPLLDIKYYKLLLNNSLENKLIASSYSGNLGVPAVFDRDYFSNLLNLKGQQGARKLLRGGSVPVASVEAGEWAVDLDTPKSYNQAYELHGRL